MIGALAPNLTSECKPSDLLAKLPSLNLPSLIGVIAAHTQSGAHKNSYC